MLDVLQNEVTTSGESLACAFSQCSDSPRVAIYDVYSTCKVRTVMFLWLGSHAMQIANVPRLYECTNFSESHVEA